MTFTEIFEAYYNLYRLEAETPTTEDDEYPVALRLANEAVNRWANYDGTYWKELFTTNLASLDGEKIVTLSSTYLAPTDMQEAGGFVRILNSDGVTVRRYNIVDPQEVQFRNDLSTYCYFTGNRTCRHYDHKLGGCLANKRGN